MLFYFTLEIELNVKASKNEVFQSVNFSPVNEYDNDTGRKKIVDFKQNAEVYKNVEKSKQNNRYSLNDSEFIVNERCFTNPENKIRKSQKKETSSPFIFSQENVELEKTDFQIDSIVKKNTLTKSLEIPKRRTSSGLSEEIPLERNFDDHKRENRSKSLESNIIFKEVK